MKTIVFIGSNKYGTSRAALTVAKEMGYAVILFTDKHSHLEFAEVDQAILIKDLLNEQRITYEILLLQKTGKQICACVSFIDPYVAYAARLSKLLGLKVVSLQPLSIMENKITLRETIKHLPITPVYWITHPEDSLQNINGNSPLPLPLVIKAPVSNGSKDVFMVTTAAELTKAIGYLRDKYPNSSLLIEEFLEGSQYLVELVVHNGVLKFMEVLEQDVIYNGKFIVGAYQYPAILEETLRINLITHISDIMRELGFSNGSCHMELKLVQNEWKLIEINPRMSGGVMNQIIEEGTGINLLKEILNTYLGEEPAFTKTKSKYVNATYLTIQSRGKLLKVKGKEQALAHPGVTYVYVKPLKGTVLKKPYSMGDRYACIIAVSETEAQAKEIAQAAAKEIKFYIEPF
ncbi:Biotin carboxylase [Psychrobacillus sp. OK028]|uniref:ATP-grasp domain-containing protein n=1 Tax=Psychrobacillus sp. OK028 TaxID=1884359 RepID=UPI00088F3E18|nr:ATP-grasp domain-containing protein [Psychrobacillus sp. OK028]SDN62733.1 Biotin carboxylase [Psychrobacillus sp. OK028]